MADTNGTEALGSVVAFEGHPETISTQLRLLPTSPQILILPGVQCYLPTDDADRKFEAHAYIREAHEAVMARNETARVFLQGSTASNKRLVFMNGGTPSAQALCIRQIMRHVTQGDDAQAEAMFNFLVKEGLAGLESQAKKWYHGDSDPEQVAGEKQTEFEPAPNSKPDSQDQIQIQEQGQEQGQEQEQEGQLDAPGEDPITRAMRAAEALDRQTANLQPSNELDLTLASRPRSASLPMYGYSDNFGDAAPFFVFGARRRANSDVTVEETVEDVPVRPMTPRFSVTHYDDQTLDQPVLTGFADTEPSPRCIGEVYGATFLHSPLVEALATSKSDVFDIRSPDQVVFEEASLVDMRPPPNKGPVTRVRSLDSLYPPIPKYHDLCIPPHVAENDADIPRRPHSCMVVPDGNDPSSSKLDFIDGPRTVMVGAKQPSTVSLAPVPAEKKRKPIRSSYVDRGTNADEVTDGLVPFSPVLPITEDLVVCFKDEAPDALLDAVIKSFKDGSYPVLYSSPEGSDADTVNDQLPTTPKSHQSVHNGEEAPTADVETAEPAVVSPSVEVDEYDPFAYVRNNWPPEKPVKSPTMKMHRPPTPEKILTPSDSVDKDEKFHEFNVASNQTAVAIQNSLRSVLNIYFPPEAQGYRQFSFALLPELEGLWKPIFREAEPGSPRANNRRMDQILAIGSQKGVKKEYSSAVTGLLDKLGAKKSGMSRSGRLDFRYLLANAMQAFTAQPLALQTSDNPFNNSYLLATLIIPHLETYLALHSGVRYLLMEYPPEHLSTILALQKLVGVDLMKVAQIVDSKSSDIRPFTHIRGASMNGDNKITGPLGKPVGSSTGVSGDVTVSQANFLLTSSASDTEIVTFVATVRKILMDVSKFYTPEEPQPRAPPKRSSANKNKLPRLSGTLSPLPKTSGLASPTTPSPTTSVGYLGQSPPPSRAHSIAETARTYKTTRTGRSTRKSKSRKRPPTADGAESIMTFDPAEDSDYDMEERRLMPIFLQKPTKLQKPNSRKALKFLGLA